ncbi:putative avirulence induced gene (AIG) protein [Candidatus Terasakiella magnetica]|nr:putative avirulence induced gene (AIG) protein [Candidatus Terasakiella magnetica]
MDLLVFGTLMDADILAAILGRRLSPAHMEAATIFDVRRVFVPRRPYPMLIRHPGTKIDGLLLRGLGLRDLARLDRYEGQEYRRIRSARTAAMTVRDRNARTRPVWLYVHKMAEKTKSRDWHFTAWRSLHKTATLARLTGPRIPSAAAAAALS